MLTVKDGKKHDWANMSLFDLAQGNSEDIYFTYKIHDILIKEVEKIKLAKLYEKLISPLTTVFARIEREGLDVDQEMLPVIGNALTKKINKSNEALRAIPEVKQYNLASSAQKCKILYTDEDGFALYPPKRSKETGNPSTDSKCLDELVFMIEEELESRKRKK